MSHIKLVEFELNGQKFGANMDHIKEIVRLSNITRVPHVQDYVKGVINLRGNIAFAIDLQCRLGLGKNDLKQNARIIIASKDENMFGFCVDAVTMVHMLDEKEIEGASESVASIDNDYIYGIAKLEENLVTVLDLEKLMDTDGLVLDPGTDVHGA